MDENQKRWHQWSTDRNLKKYKKFAETGNGKFEQQNISFEELLSSALGFFGEAKVKKIKEDICGLDLGKHVADDSAVSEHCKIIEIAFQRTSNKLVSSDHDL